ncbi:zinc-ribbon domain-containing protein [Alsobacter sp. KACC 23698]|uniref:Zinc-ribbon domain-containing protein n=1 Tax=Alsobacter sp. KACC 23698 TaxID=3149229 RepID=A0AAU7JEC0_9HYPH
MLIVCPSCASTYSLTSEQLGDGRQLRCAKCRQLWHATPADAIPESEGVQAQADLSTSLDASFVSQEAREAPRADHEALEASTAPAPEKRRPAPGRRRADAPKRTGRGLRLSTVHAAAAALLVAATLAVTQRAAIVRIMPQTAKLYAAAGAPVNLRGLEFGDLRSELVIDRDQAILVVEGQIKGVSAGETEVPKVTVSLRGAEGREIYAWTSDVSRSTLGKGESTTFRTRLVSPPAEGRDVVVRFADRDSHATLTR